PPPVIGANSVKPGETRCGSLPRKPTPRRLIVLGSMVLGADVASEATTGPAGNPACKLRKAATPPPPTARPAPNPRRNCRRAMSRAMFLASGLIIRKAQRKLFVRSLRNDQKVLIGNAYGPPRVALIPADDSLEESLVELCACRPTKARPD